MYRTEGLGEKKGGQIGKLFQETLRTFVRLLGLRCRQIIHVFSQTTALTGTICGTICEDSSPLKCESDSKHTHTHHYIRSAGMAPGPALLENKQERSSSNQQATVLLSCYHCWPCPADLNGAGAVCEFHS